MTDLRAAFAAMGVSDRDIDAAERNGTLLALAAERFLLPGERQFDNAEVAARAGVDPDHLAKLWLALGFPTRAMTERSFTDADVDAVRTLVSGGTTVSDYTLHEARVISAALGRIAEVFIDEMWDNHFAAGQSEKEALSEVSGNIDISRIEGLLLLLLRRHLVAGVYRRLALHDRAGGSGQPRMAIGFADLAGFTPLSQSLDAADLTKLVVRFEQATFDLVAELDGRIVKTIGDEVLFSFDDAPAAAEVALRLTELSGTDLPPIRIGLGWGPVLVREGDCFGPTVNLANRMVGVAGNRTVVVDAGMAAELTGEDRFAVEALGQRDLKGFGSTPLWRLVRSPSPA